MEEFQNSDGQTVEVPVSATNGEAVSPNKAATGKILGKVIAVAITVSVALLILIGLFSFYILYQNHAKEAAIASELAGKTFQYEQEWEFADDYRVEWLTFTDDGQCRVESYFASLDETVDDAVVEYSIDVSLGGAITIRVMGTDYAVEFDSDGPKLVSAFGNAYYEIQRWEYPALADYIAEREIAAQEAKKQQACELFLSMTKWPSSGHTFDTLIPIIFETYTITCTPEYNTDTNTSFIVSVSGAYYINKVDLPEITKEGEFSLRVDIEDGTGEVVSDTGIINAMQTYLALGTVWW